MNCIDPARMLDAKTLLGGALLLVGAVLVLQNPEIQNACRGLLADPRVQDSCRKAVTRLGGEILDALFRKSGAGALPPSAE